MCAYITKFGNKYKFYKYMLTETTKHMKKAELFRLLIFNNNRNGTKMRNYVEINGKFKCTSTLSLKKTKPACEGWLLD
jgi:hypothetical protein